MKTKNFFAALLIVAFAASCSKDYVFDSPELISENSELKSASPHVKIAVVSDIHYFDQSLLPQNLAGMEEFQYYMAQDPKLLDLGPAILDKVISDLLAEHPHVVFIPGDLTKDGEKISHKAFAKILKKLTDNGIKVFVIPGNHDINNPHSYSFAEQTSTPTITADEFASIYNNFGYKNSIRDKNSLSYINKINGKLWILGIDACKYSQNTTKPIVSGAIKSETMNWIQQNMIEARQKSITVLAMMHHGITEHYAGQNTLDGGYVVDDYQATATALSDAGINVVFTGHYHANDIAELKIGDKTLYDIQTGSLVSWPSPYRMMKIDGDMLNIDTRIVTSINSSLPEGMDFVTYSHLFQQQRFYGYFYYALQLKYGVPEFLAQFGAPLFQKAIMAHYAGDESLSPEEMGNIEAFANYSPDLALLRGALYSLWTDLNPKDNTITLKVK